MAGIAEQTDTRERERERVRRGGHLLPLFEEVKKKNSFASVTLSLPLPPPLPVKTKKNEVRKIKTNGAGAMKENAIDNQVLSSPNENECGATQNGLADET